MHFILNFIKARPMDSGIIYCLSRKTTEKVAEDLRKKGINAAAYHAGMNPSERSRTQATIKPTTLEQFGNISGIGEHKRQKYGERFVELIRKFV